MLQYVDSREDRLGSEEWANWTDLVDSFRPLSVFVVSGVPVMIRISKSGGLSPLQLV